MYRDSIINRDNEQVLWITIIAFIFSLFLMIAVAF